MLPLCQDQTTPIPRQPDAEGFSLVCTGGWRCTRHGADAWSIEPICDGSVACAKGFLTKRELAVFLGQYGIRPIAFHQLRWTNGTYCPHWSPITKDKSNHLQTPSNLWGQITTNSARQRLADALTEGDRLTRKKLASLIDNRGEIERLSYSIKLSLRNLDLAIAAIADYYNEQLINLINNNHLNEQRYRTSNDSVMCAHVHTFFMHIGTARDYLASLIAARIGKNPITIDSMAKLVAKIRSTDIESDALLLLLKSKNLLRIRSANSGKIEIAGWMKDVTEIRNHFVHRRPYGSYSLESTGFARAVNKDEGLYCYVRPISTFDHCE